jgi:hypothetical protein
MRTKMIVTTAALGLALAGCGPTPGTRPHDMSAKDHRDQAALHYGRANNRSTAYPVYTLRGSPWYHPWHHGWYPYYYRWDSGASYHALQGEEHLDAARQLEDEYAQACELVPLGMESVPPFDGYVTGLDELDDGVVLHLAPEAGPPDLLMLQLRCHRAWMWMEGGARMDDDPLAMEGIVVTVHATENGVDVMLTTANADDRAELRRRAAVAAARKES